MSTSLLSTPTDEKLAPALLHCVLYTLGAACAIHSAATAHGELMSLVAFKRRSLLTAGDDEEVYDDKKPQRYAEDNGSALLLIVRSGKSEA